MKRPTIWGVSAISGLRRQRGARAHRQVLGALDRAALASAQPARRARRQHQAERARQRRAVLRRDPFRERDHLGRHAQLQRTQWRQQLLRCDLAGFGQADYHAEHLTPAERNDEHRADADGAVAQLLRKSVVKRPAQRASLRHRLYLGDAGHRRTIDPAAADSGH
jgi:hypothetical protein